MKTLQKLVLSALICLTSSGYAQQKPKSSQDLAKIYSDYFALDREAVFLHLNKTTVAPQENLWFSAYVFSPQYYLPNMTTNLHVNLYDSNGKLLEAKTVYMEDGHGEGFFELNTEKYAPGEYLIRAGTKYMENFREDSYFTQSFRILGETETAAVPRKFDLQLLPEAGHLVANVENWVGVKLIDNSGKGVVFEEGKILDSQQEVITSFDSNKFGLSKFRFTPKAGENYSVSINVNDEETIQQPVPKAELRGMALSTTTYRDKVLFTFTTNAETFKDLQNKNFLFAFHKDGAMKAFNFVLSEIDMSANLTLTKDALFNGMNTITVFNENMEPILERLVFNRDSISRVQVSANYNGREADSLVINLNSSGNPGLHSMSVSVLPTESIAYNPDNNIFSAFFIEPYIQGDLENGGYYFSEKTDERRRDYDLDLLLLTQGWSKYSWQNIFDHTPQEYFKHENGFTLTGTVFKRNPKKDKNLFIGSTTDRVSAIAEIAENGSFRVQNLFIKDSAQLTFGLINDRNGNMSVPGVVANVLPGRDNGNIDLPATFGQKIMGTETGKAASNSIPENFLLGVQILDTIFLQNEILTEEEKFLERERELNKGEMFGRYDLISDEEARTFPSVVSLLYTKGFQVRASNIYTNRELTRKPLGTSWGASTLPAAIIIDGMESDFNDLKQIRITEIESIYTSKTATGQRAFLNGSGVIEVVTKNPEARIRKSTATTLLKNGFSASKEFYLPRYNSYRSEAYRNYGVIGWFPDISLENGKADIRILNTLQPDVKLFIEGMTADGALISEEIEVKIK